MSVLHSSSIQLWECRFWINSVNSLCSDRPPYFNSLLWVPFLLRFILPFCPYIHYGLSSLWNKFTKYFAHSFVLIILVLTSNAFIWFHPFVPYKPLHLSLQSIKMTIKIIDESIHRCIHHTIGIGHIEWLSYKNFCNISMHTGTV